MVNPKQPLSISLELDPKCGLDDVFAIDSLPNSHRYLPPGQTAESLGKVFKDLVLALGISIAKIVQA